MNNYYYLNAKRQPTGPVPIEGLRKLLETNEIQMNTLVIPHGSKEWVTLACVLPDTPTTQSHLPVVDEAHCPHCNESIEAEMVFCSNCGKRIGEVGVIATKDTSPVPTKEHHDIIIQPEASVTGNIFEKSSVIIGIVTAVLVAVVCYFGYDHFITKRNSIEKPNYVIGRNKQHASNSSLDVNVSQGYSRKNIKNMLDTFLNTANSKNYQMLDMYAEKVNTFNDDIVNKEALKKDMEDYFNRWNTINFTLIDDFTIGDVSNNYNIKKIDFKFKYQLKNSEKTASGISQTTWLVEYQDGSLRIIDQKEKIISKNDVPVRENIPITYTYAGGGNKEIPEAIKNFYQAVQEKRVVDAINMFSAEKIPNIKVNIIKAVAKDTEYYGIDNIDIRQNDEQKADTLVRLRHKKYKKTEELWEINVILVKENGTWKIYSTPGKKL